ncbi:MAG: superoxide dismutase [Candidatus Anstonellales archaeon]
MDYSPYASVKYELPKLEYAYNALEPVISARTLELHYSKHHAAYVNGANAAAEKLSKAYKGEDIDVKAAMRDLSFNLNGHILHSLFWESMRTPVDNNFPEGETEEAIRKVFGSFDSFKKVFSTAAKSVEGSGWAALIANGQDLQVIQIEKHNLLYLNGYNMLLVLDVWEHAYYLDYQNNRSQFVDSWWKLANWGKVEKRLKDIQ